MLVVLPFLKNEIWKMYGFRNKQSQYQTYLEVELPFGNPLLNNNENFKRSIFINYKRVALLFGLAASLFWWVLRHLSCGCSKTTTKQLYGGSNWCRDEIGYLLQHFLTIMTFIFYMNDSIADTFVN